MMGEGLKVPPLPIFICENNKKSDKIMHCVEKKKNFSGGCEGRPILWAFLTIFSRETIYLSPKLREKWPFL